MGVTRPTVDHLGNRFNTHSDMLRHYNISYDIFGDRIRRGWSLEEALTIPRYKNRNTFNRQYCRKMQNSEELSKTAASDNIIKAEVIKIHRMLSSSGKNKEILGYDIRLTHASGKVSMASYVDKNNAMKHSNILSNARKNASALTIVDEGGQQVKVGDYAKYGVVTENHHFRPFNKFGNHLDKYKFETPRNLDIIGGNYRYNYDRPVGAILDNRDNVVGFQLRVSGTIKNVAKEEAINHLRRNKGTIQVGCDESLVKENRIGAKYNTGLNSLISVCSVASAGFDAYAASKTFSLPPLRLNINFLKTENEMPKSQLNVVYKSLLNTFRKVNNGKYTIDLDLSNISGYYTIFIDKYASGFNKESDKVLVNVGGDWHIISKKLVQNKPKLGYNIYLSFIPYYINAEEGTLVIHTIYKGIARFWL